LIMKPEEWFPLGSTQQFEGLDIGTHVTQWQQPSVQHSDRLKEPPSSIAQAPLPLCFHE
jgi:hypothetical protein